MNLTVVGPRVFIRPDKLPEESKSGLVLVHGQSRSTLVGTVVAVGNGPEFVQEVVEALGHDPEPFGHIVEPGDHVIFPAEAGEELFFERELLICMREDDILAVVE